MFRTTTRTTVVTFAVIITAQAYCISEQHGKDTPVKHCILSIHFSDQNGGSPGSLGFSPEISHSSSL